MVYWVIILFFVSIIPSGNGAGASPPHAPVPSPRFSEESPKKGFSPPDSAWKSCQTCHGRLPHDPNGSGESCTQCHTQPLDPVPNQGVRESIALKRPVVPVAERKRDDEMILIPGGPFIMGYDDRHPDEKPAHTVSVAPFYMDAKEVTNREYKQFVDQTGRRPPDHWLHGTFPPGREDHPVSFVTWYDARDYCEWEGKRLPTEAEWEKAARGTDGRLFPWGNEFDPKKANTPQSRLGGTTPVGAFTGGKSPFGLYDMGGNVWEWTDSWAVAYPGNPRPDAHYFTGGYKVLKGGSWVDCSFYRCGISAFTFNRGYFKPETKNRGFGFRCAKSP